MADLDVLEKLLEQTEKVFFCHSFPFLRDINIYLFYYFSQENNNFLYPMEIQTIIMTIENPIMKMEMMSVAIKHMTCMDLYLMWFQFLKN